jgi:hypothetical protein
MEVEFKKFNEFFLQIIEICIQINSVERPYMINLKSKECQLINENCYNRMKKKYPEAINAFWVALKGSNVGIEFFLTKNQVIVNYIDHEKIMKEEFFLVNNINTFIPSFINFLTKNWNPFL